MNRITRMIVGIATVSTVLSGVGVSPTLAASEGLVGTPKTTTSAAVQIIDTDMWETDSELREESNVKINEIMFTVVNSVKKYVCVEKKMDNKISSIILPSKIKCAGTIYTVTSIQKTAFEFCEDLKSVKIPNTVTEIGNYTFWHCKSLVSVNIPDSVTNIGLCTFENCESLKSIEIPSSVKSIGAYPFVDCYSLTQIIVDKDNQYYKSINGVLYNKDGTTIIKYPEAKTDCDYVVIPDGVTTIENGAFNECKKLTIVIPRSITSIGEYAFDKTSDVYCKVYDENTKLLLLNSSHDIRFKDIIVIGSESNKSHSRSSGHGSSSNSSNEEIKTDASTQTLKSDAEIPGSSEEATKVVVSGLGGNTKGAESITTQNGNKVEIITVVTNNNQNIKVIKGTVSDKISLQTDENSKVYMYVEKLGGYIQVASQVVDDKITFNTDSGNIYVVGNENIELKSVKQGWNNVNGIWYVLGEDRTIVTGWYKDVDGKWYYLEENGSMAHDTYVGGYYVGNSGAWVE